MQGFSQWQTRLEPPVSLLYPHFIFGHTNFMVGRPQRRWDLLPSRFINKVFVYFDRIKGGVSQKGSGVDERMLFEEIFQNRNQCFGIGRGFVFVRGICFFSNHDIRMGGKKVLIVEACELRSIRNNIKATEIP